MGIFKQNGKWYVEDFANGSRLAKTPQKETLGDRRVHLLKAFLLEPERIFDKLMALGMFADAEWLLQFI